MSEIRPIVIDFETEAIGPRPTYPPKPVGFSICGPGIAMRYYAWGHPSGNNTTFEQAQAVLRKAWESKTHLLFHNAKFDVDVAQTHMGMGPIEWQRVHDTMFLLFLHDPYATSFALKSAAESILGLAPSEQLEVRQWLMERGITKGGKDWGAHISKAPGDLVGKYADGDVLRTELLYRHLLPFVQGFGMRAAYDRERELMPALLENEREGIRVDTAKLNKDVGRYLRALADADAWIIKRLGSPSLNVDSDPELAEALSSSGVVTEWALTPTGKRSTSKKNLLPDAFTDQEVAAYLGYRNRLKTCLSTFMLPWQEMSSATGRIYTNWNQVRQSGNSATGFAGARTGRLSSNPNFQNIPKDFDRDRHYKALRQLLPTTLPPLPMMRKYVLPDEGQSVGHLDYRQQEFRILAHFEDGELLRRYSADPALDIHVMLQSEINRIYGLELTRDPVKTIGFGILYGMGLGLLAAKLEVPFDEARSLKSAFYGVMPGIRPLETLLKERGRSGEAITTWGGRRYLVEPPKVVDGSLRTFEYKLLNYLVQGSAADCTKQALINYNTIKRNGRLLCTVHDEINISIPKGAEKEEMKLLKEAMEGINFDVPMLTDAKLGKTWGDLKEFNNV